ncbi:MAG: RNA-binding S4 domain-containing protein [Acetobacteraceae bacterium]
MNAGGQDWQRLDHWLWCARFRRTRAACTAWVEEGGIRLNRRPTDKPHARLRPGDALTLPVAHGGSVVRVLALGSRRGAPDVARALYAEIPPPEAGRDPCATGASPAYPPASKSDHAEPGNQR